MRRDQLLIDLRQYLERFPKEYETVARFIRFVEGQKRCFDRDCWNDGHVTASALVMNTAGSHTLLTHHAKLRRWLQLGGHSDGVPVPLETALREAGEESGLQVEAISTCIFDIDIHAIPARGLEPEHFHYDVRFVLRSTRSDSFTVSDESLDLAWVRLDEVPTYTQESSILRMMSKYELLLSQ